MTRLMIPAALSATIMALAACDPTAPGPDGPYAAPANDANGLYAAPAGNYGGRPGGLAPPPGRTAQERSERRSYYMGPRGDEF